LQFSASSALSVASALNEFDCNSSASLC